MLYNPYSDVSLQDDIHSWIVMPGQLVCVKTSIYEKNSAIGIIISCSYPNFGVGPDEEYLVLLDGDLKRIKTFMLYPISVAIK